MQEYFSCEQLLIPGISDFSSQCWLGITYLLGQNIREMYLSNVWRMSYQGLSSDIPLAPKYCIHPNNSIEVLDCSDNYASNFIEKGHYLTEIWFSGFTNLRYLNLEDNRLPFSLSRNCNFPNHAKMGQTSIVNVDTDTLYLICNPPIVRIVLESSFGTLLLISLVLGILLCLLQKMVPEIYIVSPEVLLDGKAAAHQGTRWISVW